MAALVISLVAGYRPFHPSLLGKASTAAQMATIFVAVCAGLASLTLRLRWSPFAYTLPRL